MTSISVNQQGKVRGRFYGSLGVAHCLRDKRMLFAFEYLGKVYIQLKDNAVFLTKAQLKTIHKEFNVKKEETKK